MPTIGISTASPRGILGEFNSDDVTASVPFSGEPVVWVANPVDADGVTQRVASAQGFRYPAQSRHRQTGPHGLAGAKQGTEIEPMHRPKRCCDEVTPA